MRMRAWPALWVWLHCLLTATIVSLIPSLLLPSEQMYSRDRQGRVRPIFKTVSSGDMTPQEGLNTIFPFSHSQTSIPILPFSQTLYSCPPIPIPPFPFSNSPDPTPRLTPNYTLTERGDDREYLVQSQQ